MARREVSPQTVRLTTVLLLVATFAAGTLSGAGLGRWLSRGSAPPPPPMLVPFEEVGLTPDQRQKTNAIMEQHRPEFEATFRETFPKMRAINDQIEREVREVLTQEQRTKLDEIKARRHNHPPGHPPHGGPSGSPRGNWHGPGDPGDWPPPPGPPPDGAPP
jgi:Spy/CpxP family protein refolding chaperone